MKQKILTAAVLVVGMVFGTDAHAETVRLKNGQTITGTVLVDENDPSGIRIQRWDTGGVIALKWSQIVPVDRDRLSKNTVTQVAKEDVVDAVRILTSINVYQGTVDNESDTDVTLKTRDGQRIIPKSSIEKREPIKMKMEDLYSPVERVEIKAKNCKENDAACMLEIAQFARSLNLYVVAATYYAKAADLAPDRAEEIATLLTDMKTEKTNSEAKELFDAILHNMQTHRFDDADKLAKKLQAEYGSTEIAQKNQDFPDRIAAAREEYIKTRDVKLAKELPNEWRSLRASMIRKSASDTKSTLKQTMSYVNTQLDKEVLKQLMAKYALTQEETLRFWDQRDQLKKTAKYGAGSWIVTGGSSGKQLPTAEEWWQSVSSSVRAEWLEAMYAESSAYVKVVETKKDIKCSLCNGTGTLEAQSQQGKPAPCPRCHGARYDLTITYY